MGVENNECVIATTWDAGRISEIKEWIKTVDPRFQILFAILPSVVNGKQTVIFAPDGSKKGWADAEAGEAIRNEFIEKLESYNYEDDSNPFDFVEVGYGEFGQKVLRENCKNMYGDEEYATGAIPA